MNCPNLAEILFPHVDDSETWCKLAQVNRRFNEVAKRLLVRKKEIHNDCDEMWTELPSNGKRHGVYQKFFKGGMIWAECQFKNDWMHGTYERWYPSGEKNYESNQINGLTHGLVQEWFPNGVLASEKNYSYGSKHGLSKKWNSRNQLRSEKMFLGGVLYKIIVRN